MTELNKERRSIMEEKQWYIFTFGYGHEHQNKYVKIYGDFFEARAKMFAKYGDKWAFQYTENSWNEWERTRPSYLPVETMLEEIGEE